eukprot:289677_1
MINSRTYGKNKADEKEERTLKNLAMASLVGDRYSAPSDPYANADERLFPSQPPGQLGPVHMQMASHAHADEDDDLTKPLEAGVGMLILLGILFGGYYLWFLP